MATELSLEAALRDFGSKESRARNLAVRNLAPALLAEAGLRSPTWDAAEHHKRGSEVLALLEKVIDEEGPHQDRGMAMIGLGQLGHASTVERALEWLNLAGRDEASMFLRESAVIALSMIGACTPEDEVRARVLDLLGRGMSSEHDDVRFQSAMALAETGDDAVQPMLVDALRRESDMRVRENLVCALATFDPPNDEACEALEAVLDEEDQLSSLGFEAALALAAARRTSSIGRLVDGLTFREERDRSLEALAALGSVVPESALSPIRALTTGWFTPSLTKVRAAYALARIRPKEGLPILHKLARHIRPAVREGVRDAYAAIAELTEREQAD